MDDFNAKLKLKLIVNLLLQEGKLTFNVRECAEGSARAVARVLDVVALGRLVDLGVELLLGARVAVLAVLARLARHRVAPLVAGLDLRARSRPATIVSHVSVAFILVNARSSSISGLSDQSEEPQPLAFLQKMLCKQNCTADRVQ